MRSHMALRSLLSLQIPTEHVISRNRLSNSLFLCKRQQLINLQVMNLKNAFGLGIRKGVNKFKSRRLSRLIALAHILQLFVVPIDLVLFTETQRYDSNGEAFSFEERLSLDLLPEVCFLALVATFF